MCSRNAMVSGIISATFNLPGPQFDLYIEDNDIHILSRSPVYYED